MPVSMVVVHLKVLCQTFAQMVQMVLDKLFLFPEINLSKNTFSFI